MQDIYSKNSMIKFSILFLWTAAITALTGCGDNTGTTLPGTVTITATALQLVASPATVKSDNSTTTTITVTALDAGNAVVPNTPVTITTDAGVLSSSSVTTGADGTATLTFSSGTSSHFNRTANITATAGAAAKTLPINITGSTLTLATAATNSISTGTPVTLSATAKDAGGNPVSGQTVNFTVTTGSGTFSPGASATTDSGGVASVSFTATAAGSAVVKADWLDSPAGASTVSATQTFTVASAGSAFQLITPASSPFPVTLGATQAVTAYIPATILSSTVTNVRFTASLGSWQSSGTKSQTVAFTAAGNYTQTFVAGTSAGIANVQVDVLDASGAVLSSAQTVLSLSASAANASQISLQANVSSISPSTGSISSTATLTATVRDASNNPVGNAPVLFELVNPTGSGEQVIPVTVMTAATQANGVAVGQAQSTFIAGTQPTNQGLQIRASIVGTAISGTTTITVGGVAGSIAIGTSSSIASVNGDTSYQLPVTVIVTDSAGVAVPGAVVSLSLWPESYNKGTRNAVTCAVAYDTTTGFDNEDTNRNLILDGGEDVDGPGGHGAGTPFYGAADGVLWPQSSAAGSVPQTVTTGSDGSASFNWTYLKDYASWLKVRMQARTTVQGTEATSVSIVTLPTSGADTYNILFCPLRLTSPFN